jgi:endoglucanase
VHLSAADAVLATLLELTVAAFHGQRCGTAVDLGGGYRYEACHLRAAFHPSAQAISKTLPVTKGWHDAGDYGRYVVNSGISAGTLLWAWELYPAQFRDIDLLGEVRWNLEWMLSMQDEDGGVWHKQTSLAFPGFVMPHEDDTVSYVIGKGSCATANLAAVSAIAARVYEKTDVAFAQKNLGAATRAWIWLKKNPNVVYRNPSDVTTGEYGDRDCSDERLWAAAELWRTAKDADAASTCG